MFDLAGKVIVITGGLGQLGYQFAQTLLKRGAKVAVLDLVSDEAAISRRYGGQRDKERVDFLACDVTSKASLQAAHDHIIRRWGVPHGLINNAAIDSPPGAPAEENGPFENYPEAAWERVMDVNVKGVFLASQIFGDEMARQGRGSIINISSVYGMVSPDQSLYQYRRDRGEAFFKPVAYAASKSALLNLTRYLAAYWGPRNLRVNTVSFAGVFNGQDQEFLHRYTAKVPLGRMADETDYNGAIVFLLSDASAYMTGSNIVIDGGFTSI
jgi:NAD(P)-dependent dehydrogenase (short-subunit alcohol dehydrogenase family)